MQSIRAFTLVELAIVIVIIGLLVGGVLQGRELIEQARLRRVISDVENYSAAFATFFGKYNAVPGDMRNATTMWGEVSPDCTVELGTGTQTCNGDGDRRVDYDNGADIDGTIVSHWEGFRFWQHLKNANLIKASVNGEAIYCGGINPCYVGNVNVPLAPIPGSVWGFWQVGNQFWSGKLTPRHAFGLGNTRWGSGRWHGVTLTPEAMMAFDSKFDDGMPYRGKIVNMNYSNSANCTSTGNATIDANATYNVSFDKEACIPLIDSKFDL
jgi:prepilin-type N-terminal cleavage/methylation domain-containing protein